MLVKWMKFLKIMKNVLFTQKNLKCCKHLNLDEYTKIDCQKLYKIWFLFLQNYILMIMRRIWNNCWQNKRNFKSEEKFDDSTKI